MVITHHGNQCYKLQFGDTTVAINPISKDSKLKAVRFGADICLVSVNHPDFNGTDQVSFGDKQPFAITGPGEYETKGIFIKGFASHSSYGGKDRINTVYTFTLDGLNVCFMGALDTKDLSADLKSAIDTPDILFVPIGGEGTLHPQDAYKLAVQFEPKLIVPIGFEDNAIKDALKLFVKESGEGEPKAIDKLTIKKKDLEGKDSEVVVISTS